MVIIGHKTFREKLGIDVLAHVKKSALKVCGHPDGAGVKLTARVVGDANAVTVLRGSMTVTEFGPGATAPGDVDDDGQTDAAISKPMIFQDFDVEMQDRVAVSETAVDYAVDHGFPSKFVEILRDIGFCTYLDVFRRAVWGHPPEHVDYGGAASARCKGVASKDPART